MVTIGGRRTRERRSAARCRREHLDADVSRTRSPTLERALFSRRTSRVFHDPLDHRVVKSGGYLGLEAGTKLRTIIRRSGHRPLIMLNHIRPCSRGCCIGVPRHTPVKSTTIGIDAAGLRPMPRCAERHPAFDRAQWDETYVATVNAAAIRDGSRWKGVRNDRNSPFLSAYALCSFCRSSRTYNRTPSAP